MSMMISLTVLFGQPSWAQTYARAQKIPQNIELKPVPEKQKLRVALHELQSHYHVDILFEGGMVEGIMISTDLSNFSMSLESNLNKILLNSGLNYKKVKDGSYVILEDRKIKYKRRRW